MTGIPVEYYYPIFSGFMFTLAYLLIPQEKYINLFWFGLFWGFLLNIIYYLIFGNLFNLFQYQYAEPFTFFGSPLWLNFAWIFAVMLYMYFLPQSKVWYLRPLYITSFSMAGAALDMLFNKVGLLEYINWNPVYRFIFAVLFFYGISLHQKVLAHQDNEENNRGDY